MCRSIYLINPRESGPSYHSMDFLKAWGLVNATGLADLSTTTIAAFAPQGWTVTICDERVQTVDFDTNAAYIGITGKVTQRQRMKELAETFRRKGKIVLIGGPHASLNPEDVRAHCDILVRGEIEDIAEQLFAALAAGQWSPEYIGGKPDLRKSPVPRWDLYPRGLALAAQVQTSRGCPFECEFCDVIQYAGRKQRWKEPPQVISELELLYEKGFRDVFLADDNLTVFRKRARDLLTALAEWNGKLASERMRFTTQVSVDIARDGEMLDLCRRAGLENVFIGIETPNVESLAETQKRQNLNVDLKAAVEKFARAGIMVIGGFIVGFDHDGPDIFDRQAQFIQQLPVPIAQMGLLVAPHATPLYARLQSEGRLIDDGNHGAGNLLSTNIMPLRMSLDAQREGMKWLLNRIYAPVNFAARLKHFADLCPRPQYTAPRPRVSALEAAIARTLAQHGQGERMLVVFLENLLLRRPDLHSRITYALLGYAQLRHMLDTEGIWDPVLGTKDMLTAA